MKQNRVSGHEDVDKVTHAEVRMCTCDWRVRRPGGCRYCSPTNENREIPQTVLEKMKGVFTYIFQDTQNV